MIKYTKNKLPTFFLFKAPVESTHLFHNTDPLTQIKIGVWKNRSTKILIIELF